MLEKPEPINYFKTDPEKVLTPVERLANMLLFEMCMMMLARTPLDQLARTVENRLNEFLAQRDAQA